MVSTHTLPKYATVINLSYSIVAYLTQINLQFVITTFLKNKLVGF